MAAPGQKAPSEEELRELMMRADQVRQQLGAMEGQREYLAEVVTETRRALTTLRYLTDAKPGEEMLVPLGAGAFVAARIVDPSKAIASLGSGVQAELTTPQAAERLVARVDNLESAQTALAKDIARLAEELARANSILEGYYGGG